MQLSFEWKTAIIGVMRQFLETGATLIGPIVSGHLLRTGTIPGVATGAGIGTGGSPAVTMGAGSTDTAGVVNVTTGNTGVGTVLAVVTFATAWGTAPFVVVGYFGTPGTGQAVGAISASTTQFSVALSAAASSNTAYAFAYLATSTS